MIHARWREGRARRAGANGSAVEQIPERSPVEETRETRDPVAAKDVVTALLPRGVWDDLLVEATFMDKKKTPKSPHGPKPIPTTVLPKTKQPKKLGAVTVSRRQP